MPAAKSLIQCIFDRAFNQGDLAVVDELVAVDGITLPERRTSYRIMCLKKIERR